MVYKVIINKEKKVFEKLPLHIRKALLVLVDELREEGPIQKEWYNFSDLGKDKYHCHLARSWVACWESKKDSLLIEVYYAGSRENAPY